MKNFCYLSIIIKPYRIGASSNRNLLTNRLHDRKGSDSVFGYKVSTLNSGFITLRLRDKIWTFLYRIYVWRVNTKRISDQNVSDSSRIRKLLLWCKSSLNDVVRSLFFSHIHDQARYSCLRQLHGRDNRARVLRFIAE